MTRPRGPSAGIRWRDDVGWEKRCENCVHSARPGGAYWPLTFEFWDPKRSMVRCRACWRHYKNAAARYRLAAHLLVKRVAEKRASQAAWRARRRAA